MNRALKLLLLDPSKLGPALSNAFSQASFGVKLLADLRAVAAELQSGMPDLLLMRAELRSPEVAQALTAVNAAAASSALPVALLCQDTVERRFLKSCRTGIVDLLPTLLAPGAYVARVRVLLQELPQRSGVTAGEGDQKEIGALLKHLKQTQRSGSLKVNPGTREAGQAVFLKGELRSARWGEAKDAAALTAIAALPAASWTFTEMGGGGGEGAGVVIEVGRHQAPPAAPAPELRPAAPSGEATPILVVDDDPMLCRMFSILFGKHGYAVTTARDGFSGYEAAASGKFELITADLKLPRLDGWGMLRLLREDYRTRELPLAFLSCHDRSREALQKVEPGAQAYLSKEMGLDALVAQVSAILEPRRAFRRKLEARSTLQASFGALGPQWVLKELARTGGKARVVAKDAWANYQLFFLDGRPIHALAQSSAQKVEGERALIAWVASRAAEGAIDFGSFEAPRTLSFTLEEHLERATAALNDKERKLRAMVLASSGGVEVNHSLYELYLRVCPPDWQQVARLLCSERVPPREVGSRLNLPANEVEDAVKDLFRRGVVTLREPPK